MTVNSILSIDADRSSVKYAVKDEFKKKPDGEDQKKNTQMASSVFDLEAAQRKLTYQSQPPETGESASGVWA